MHTPKTLTDLAFRDNVIRTKPTLVDSTANRFFHELFNAAEPVYVRHIFTEDGQKVYEAFQDSGSDDYLYIIESEVYPHVRG